MSRRNVLRLRKGVQGASSRANAVYLHFIKDLFYFRSTKYTDCEFFRSLSYRDSPDEMSSHIEKTPLLPVRN
jgi:hypothetical protein